MIHDPDPANTRNGCRIYSEKSVTLVEYHIQIYWYSLQFVQQAYYTCIVLGELSVMFNQCVLHLYVPHMYLSEIKRKERGRE